MNTRHVIDTKVEPLQMSRKPALSMRTLWAVGAAWLMAQGAYAATFQTFVNDEPGFLAAIGTGTVVQTEDFSAAVDGQQLAAEAPAAPDVWNGFTVQMIGPAAGAWGPSRYCTQLNSATCIYWNANTPAVPGIYGTFSSNPGDRGISIKPSSSTIAGFSFDFSDWNDGRQRSLFTVLASDGSSTVVTGPTNPGGAPPMTFGVTLSPADIAAGLYITEIRWVGYPPSGNEVVGFYNFKTYTNPVLTPVPTLSGWALMLLSAGCAGMLALSRRRRAQ